MLVHFETSAPIYCLAKVYYFKHSMVFISGIIVLSALSILTPYFQYIPKSSLSAVLIAAVIFMVCLQSFRKEKSF